MMRFSVRFNKGASFGAASTYTLREFCVSVVDRYSLSEKEISAIVSLQVNQAFTNKDVIVKRVA